VQKPKPNGGITPERAISVLDELASKASGSRIDHFTWQNAIRCFVGLNNEVATLTSRNAELEAKVATLTSRNSELEAEVATLTSRNAELEAEVATLTSSNAELEADPPAEEDRSVSDPEREA
jgi:predicted nuclease with TOPRIM domain